MGDSRRAILLLAHGTPDEPGDIPAYLRNVVSGRPMPQHVIDEITHRYGLIGKSPLTALTLQQAALLQDALHVPVYVGMRNWKPYIADVVRQMKADGITETVAICLAPQNSRTSVGLYRRAVTAEAGDAIRVDFVDGWAEHPKLAEAFAARLAPVLAQEAVDAAVLFTAHSVPCRTVLVPEAGSEGWAEPASQGADPYAIESKKTAALVAAQLGLAPQRWFFAFQSQGMSGGPWIGPTVEDTLTTMHGGGVRTVVLQTIGFLCDHVEILYDIDIAFREFAEGLGMRLVRPASLNDSPVLTEALVELAQAGLARLHAQEAPTAL